MNPNWDHFAIKGEVVRKVNTMAEWQKLSHPSLWMDDLMDDKGVLKCRISTVFFGIDPMYELFGREPMVFETMVFGGAYDLYQCRYASYQEAKEGHEKVVARLKKNLDL